MQPSAEMGVQALPAEGHSVGVRGSDKIQLGPFVSMATSTWEAPAPRHVGGL